MNGIAIVSLATNSSEPRKNPEKIVPLPMISLTAPMHVRESVKPSPIPIPSKAESRTPFLFANISALPRMIQLTTIRGRNTPSEL